MCYVRWSSHVTMSCYKDWKFDIVGSDEVISWLLYGFILLYTISIFYIWLALF